jgi:hypothetical protein
MELKGKTLLFEQVPKLLENDLAWFYFKAVVVLFVLFFSSINCKMFLTSF